MKTPVQSILLISAITSLLITAGCAKSFQADVQSLPPANSQPIDAEKNIAENLPDQADKTPAESPTQSTTPAVNENEQTQQQLKQEKTRQTAEQQLNPYKLSDDELEQFKTQVFQQEVNAPAVIPSKPAGTLPKVHTRGQSLYEKTKPKPTVTAPTIQQQPTAGSDKPATADNSAVATTTAQQPSRNNSALQDLINTGAELKPNDKVVETLEMCKNLSTEKKQDALVKKQFLCKLLPPALRMQQLVFKQRLSILSMMRKQTLKVELSKEELIWLDQIRKFYRLTEKASWQDFLERVDITPLPLLFAQSVLESRWGQDLIAVKGNNYFGVKGFASNSKCWDKPDSKNMCHKSYASIDESVSDYIHFLNTTQSSTKFRKARRQMRENGVPFNSFTLIATLDQYSIRRGWYISTISDLMKNQKFVSMILSEEMPE